MDAPRWHAAVVSDPFSDAEFTGRAGKLLRMLASDHAGEAEAARLKLLQWLDQHGTTINDVADRLGGPARRPAEPDFGNGSGSARDMAMLRAQVREAEIIAAEALRANERQRLQAARAMQERRRERLIGSGACLALAGLSLWLLARPAPAPVTVVRVVPAAPAPPPPAASPQRPALQEAAPAMPPPPAWERPAYVTVEQAQLRSVPTNGDIVAGLERGDRVTILQGPYSGWVLVRSKQGLGWLRSLEVTE